METFIETIEKKGEVSFETAFLANRKGFKEKCKRCYVKGVGGIELRDTEGAKDVICMAPERMLLKRWVKEKYKINILIDLDKGLRKWSYSIVIGDSGEVFFEQFIYDDIDQALEGGLKRAMRYVPSIG